MLPPRARTPSGPAVWLFRVLLNQTLIHYCIAKGMDVQYQQVRDAVRQSTPHLISNLLIL